MRKNWKVALCVIGCCGSIMMNVYAQDVERNIGACVQKVEIIEPYYTNISNVNVTKGYKYRTVAVVDCGGEKVTKYSNSVFY